MKKKQVKLGLGKMTVANLEDMDQAKGGWLTVTYLSNCCTVNMATCIVWQTECNTADTYQPGGTACP